MTLAYPSLGQELPTKADEGCSVFRKVNPEGELEATLQKGQSGPESLTVIGFSYCNLGGVVMDTEHYLRRNDGTTVRRYLNRHAQHLRRPKHQAHIGNR